MKKRPSKKTVFERWLELRAKAKRQRFMERYKGSGAKILSLDEFKSAILKDLIVEKRKAILEKAGARRKSTVEEKFRERDQLSTILRGGRQLDLKGWGSGWDNPLSKVRRYYKKDLKVFIRQAVAATKRKRVLFLGAGTGRAAAQLAREMGKEAKFDGTALRRLPQHGAFEKQNRNLEIRVCHFGNMVKKLGKGKYALIFSYGATNRVEDPLPVLKNVRLLLAKGGIALLDTAERIPKSELEKWSEAIQLETESAYACQYILQK